MLQLLLLASTVWPNERSLRLQISQCLQLNSALFSSANIPEACYHKQEDWRDWKERVKERGEEWETGRSRNSGRGTVLAEILGIILRTLLLKEEIWRFKFTFFCKLRNVHE